MGLRFQKRVRLFPGVRLNFSFGGISTTIGVRGASITLGSGGAHLNLGIPGTGLSYRTRIAPAPHRRRPATRSVHPPQPTVPAWGPSPPAPLDAAEEAGAIRSAEVGTLTSQGLGELKKLINEAARTRRDLQRELADSERAVTRARWRLQCACLFILRIFTHGSIPRLLAELAAAQTTLDAARRRLEGCAIDIDFAFDAPTLESYAALIRTFTGLSGCQRIWDVTASVLTNRFVERTTATHRLARKVATLKTARSDIVRTEHQAMVFTNANGNDLYIYPGFILVPDASGDFALIEIRELGANFTASYFIEEEQVPPDGEVISYTWKKANKDGSRDKRFANNYQIPIVKYGEIAFRSPTGLNEVFQFSNHGRAAAFCVALSSYRDELFRLAQRSKASAAVQVVSTGDNEGDDGEDEPVTPVHLGASTDSVPNLIADYFALALVTVSLAFGGLHASGKWPEVTWNGDETGGSSPSQTPPPQSVTAVPPRPPSAETKPSALPGSLPATTTVVAPISPPAAVSPTAPPLTSELPRDVVYVVVQVANVRADASGGAAVVGTLKRGTKMYVFQRRDQWVQVGEATPIGWVYQSLLGSSPPN